MPEISTAGIFQVAFIARQMEQTPRAFFQTTFEPVGRVCAARHARGGLGLQGKWRTRACVPHTPYMRATACLGLPLILGRLKRKKAACTTYFPCRTLNPNSHPVLSPRGRELERGQQATRLVLGQLGNLGKVAAIWRMPSPTGEGADCSGFCGCRRFKKQLGFTAVDFRSSEK